VHEPDAAQLVEGEALRRAAVNLESPWSGWPDAARLELRGGRDFDDVILGVPPGALRPISAKLAERSPRGAPC
jgi:hypothetical protein